MQSQLFVETTVFVGRNRYNACPTFGLRVRFFQQGCLLKKPCVQHSCVYVHMYFYFLFPPKMLHKFYRSKALNEVEALEESWLRTKDVRTWMGNFFQKCRSESGLTLASLLCGVLYFLTFSPNPNSPPPQWLLLAHKSHNILRYLQRCIWD